MPSSSKSLPSSRPANPDARLISACKKSDAAYIQYVLACSSDEVDSDPEINNLIFLLVRRMNRLRRKIAALPATTLEGLRAKATTALYDIPKNNNGDPEDDTLAAVVSVLRDVQQFALNAGSRNPAQSHQRGR